MNLLNSPFGLRVGPQIQNPEELFKTKDDIEKRLIVTLWRISPEEVTKWLQEEKDTLHQRYSFHGPKSEASIPFDDFKSNAESVFQDDNALNERSHEILYHIVIATGTFPFPPEANTTLNTVILITAMGLLRNEGARAIRSPGYYLPREAWKDPMCWEGRQRGSKEQLRFLFQTLASSNSAPIKTNVTNPDSNEDLLDVIALAMDLDHESKVAYFPKDFREALSGLPSSESDRKLNFPMSWDDLKCL